MAERIFCLNGQQLIFDGDVDKYVELKKLHNKLYYEHFLNFLEEYDKAEDAEDVLSITSTLGKAEIEELYMGFAEYYFEKGIYDFSEAYLSKNGGEEYVMEPLDEKLGELRDQLDDIDRRQAYEESRRAARKESRGRFIGGGFGIGGAISGAMKAGMLNLGTGLAHSAFNAVGNAISSANASSERASVYEDSKDEVLSAVLEAMENVFAVVVTQLGLKTGFDFPKSASILKNVQKGIIKEPVLGKACLDGIKCDPFNKYYYAYFLENIENEKAVFEMADYFGVDLTEQKKELHEAYGVYFEDTKQTKIVNNEMKKLEEFLKAKKYDVSADEVLTEKYYKELLDLNLPNVLIGYFEEVVRVYEDQEEVKKFFLEKLQFLQEAKNTVSRNIEEKERAEAAKRIKAQREEKEKNKRIERRKKVLQYLNKSELADLSCYAYRKVSGKSFYCSEIPAQLVENAYNSYGKKLKIDKSRILLLIDDSWSGDATSGVIMTDTEFVSSRGNRIGFDEIIKVNRVFDSSIRFETVNDSDYEFFNITLDDNENEAFWDIMNGIFDPMSVSSNIWIRVEMYYQSHYVKSTSDNTQGDDNKNSETKQNDNAPVYASEDDYRRAVINSYAPSGIAYWISDYFKSRTDWSFTHVYPNIAENKVQNAKKAYAAELGFANNLVLFLYDDTIFGSGEKGFMIVGECIVSSRKEAYALNTIKNISLDMDGVVKINFINGASTEFFRTMIRDHNSSEWQDFNNYFSWLFNHDPKQIPLSLFQLMESGFKGPKYSEQQISNATESVQQEVYTIEGSYLDRVNQIMNIQNMGWFTNVYVGKRVKRKKVQAAIESYLGAYYVAAEDVWFQITTVNDGSQGLAISKTYLLNSLGQGFTIDQVQSVQLLESGHVYVVTKDGQGYYLMEGGSFAAKEIELINQILAAMFYDQPCGMRVN